MGAALEPLAEDVNTEVPELQNTAWDRVPAPSGGEVFRLFTTRPVRAGEELLEGYASARDADNERMFTHWGMVLEDNPTRLKALDVEPCRTLAATLRKNLSSSSPAPALLDRRFSRRPSRQERSVRACRPPSEEKQAGIFCAFLNLAREYCRADLSFP